VLTREQEEWINSLNYADKVVIKPFDPTAESKFQTVKKQIQAELGPGQEVKHRGASSLGISGQDEIDVYVPVKPEEFNGLMPHLEKLFGPPASLHLIPLDRVRYVTHVEGKRVDVYLMNKESTSWLNGMRFEKYLITHREILERYRILKEECAGLSTRAYYRRKVEFINAVLELAAREDRYA